MVIKSINCCCGFEIRGGRSMAMTCFGSRLFNYPTEMKVNVLPLRNFIVFYAKDGVTDSEKIPERRRVSVLVKLTTRLLALFFFFLQIFLKDTKSKRFFWPFSCQ